MVTGMKHSISAGGIVYRQTPNGVEWLICQSVSHMGWVFPKGQVGDHVLDETIPEAALREVREEGGVTARIVGMLTPPVEYLFDRDGDQTHKIVHYFLMEYVSGDPTKHDKEILEAKFVDSSTALGTLSFDNDIAVFQSALHQLNQLGPKN